jgi:hypothetical protein
MIELLVKGSYAPVINLFFLFLMATTPNNTRAQTASETVAIAA